MSRYFENDDSLLHKDIAYEFEILGEKFTFHGDNGVFSKASLDDGTKLLLENIAKMDLGTSILDLGCGVGPIGLVLAHADPSRHVVLADINDRALDCARINAENLGVTSQVQIVHSDVYTSISNLFSTIVTNPPIRAGKKVTYAMYAGAVSHLLDNGKLILVIRKQQGASSCMDYLKTLFKSVEKVAQKKGYRILIASK